MTTVERDVALAQERCKRLGMLAVPRQAPTVRRAEEYGSPETIRSDSGAPFASTGVSGLTALSAWWIKLGIRHERIDPGHPQQSGRHERFEDQSSADR